MRTFQQTTAEATHDWYVVDASGARLGTLAVRIARVLAGRQKPTWTPHIDAGDFVVVVNAEKVELGGKKWTQKVYRRHSGYPGGLSEQTAGEVRRKHPERLIERAVRGMLAGNRLRDDRLNRLKVYVGPEHPHAAQAPKELV
ncbi:MAG: 50S ribosomal protein L13 [Vulcanimicrobiaceae bacterium]